MSKIYEALRRHEEDTRTGAAAQSMELELSRPMGRGELSRPWPKRSASSKSPAGDRYMAANQQMQTLHRSVEALLEGVEGGAMLMISSAHAGEGKTTVCGSFATMLAQTCGKAVLVIDGDHAHALTHLWGATKDVSLSALDEVPEALLPGANRFGAHGSISVVPAGAFGGTNGGGPDLELLGAMRGALARTFDYILIDAPSVADLSWGPAIGSLVDGVILVVEAERTRWPVALNARREFEGNGARVLGVFLNKRRFYIPARIYRRM
jgi:Mrp family chromosome partitioning ATPase